MAAATVTVLFTDLVGSTALLSRVGEERAEELRREHFALLRTALTSTGGREVKNLGDGLMVVFDGAADAMAGAVAVQQAFEQRNRTASEPLTVRVGLSSGDADVEDGDYFGVPVVEAARLCAQADGGGILTTELVRLLAGTRGGFEFEAVGDLELKGLDRPVTACRVLWMPAVTEDTRPPMSARLLAARSATFVGRQEEFEQFATTFKSVHAGEGCRVMLLAGEPGIGKTTLAAQFASDVFEQGAVVLYGRSDEDLGIPYQPWIEALTPLVDAAPEHLLAAHVDDRGLSLARLVPNLATRLGIDRPPLGEGDAERFVLFGCVTDLLARVAEQAPVLVVLDDLHWADRPSLQLLRQVVTADPPVPVAVLGTFRDSDVTAGDPMTDLLAALHRQGGAQRVVLRGLTDTDLLALLEGIAGHEMPDDGVALRDALARETAGNPFFVGEILRHLAETGAIYQLEDGRWAADPDLRAAGLPVSVREVVGRRLAALGPDTDRALGLAAVIGRDFDIGLLAAVAHLDEDSVVDLCDAAVAAAVLQTTDQPDRYSFAHALIEHTLYDGLSRARRSRAHFAVAEALEAELGGDPGERAGELAYHWAAATQPADTSKAIRYAQIAGQRALDQLAPEEALRWFGQALDLLDRSPAPVALRRERAEVLVGLGVAQRQFGVAAYRETLLESARLADEIDAVDLLVRAALANNRGWFSATGDTDHDRIAVIDRALERLDDPDSPDGARLLTLACTERMYVGDLDGRVARAERAVDAARRSGEEEALAFALLANQVTIYAPHTSELRTVWIDEALGLVEGLADPTLRYLADANAAWCAMERGDRAALDHHLVASERAVERAPAAALRWLAAYFRAVYAVLDGELAEAERIAQSAFEYGTENGQHDAFTIFSAQFASIRHLQGRLSEILPMVEQAMVASPALVVYRAVLALGLAYDGQLDRASALLDEQVATGLPMPLDSAWSTGLACWAEAAFLTGHAGAARLLHDRMASFHAHIVTTIVTVQPSVAHYLGLLDCVLGRFDDADRWFAEALDIHQRLEAPLLVAETRSRWAALLAARGEGDDRQRARAMAEQALESAVARDYGHIEADARAVLGQVS